MFFMTTCYNSMILHKETSITDCKLAKLNVDIAVLQETRLLGTSSLREQEYTFFWQGKNPEAPCIHDVGFAVRNKLLSSVLPKSKCSSSYYVYLAL